MKWFFKSENLYSRFSSVLDEEKELASFSVRN